MSNTWNQVGFYPADILLPRDCDMEKWAVVACDQFTSQPEYWAAVDRLVGDAPSTLRLILPEAELKAADVDERIQKIHETMHRYLEMGLFRTLEQSLLYVERRQSDGRVRRGIVGMVDLEQYDYTPGSQTLIRATEGTVLERIPPRVKVRRGAPLELPHVMLLADDPDRTVIEPLSKATDSMEQVYNFSLMQQGGHIRAFRLTAEQMEGVAAALVRLKEAAGGDKYGLPGAAPLLFAVGDGNHSLATAKACYEERKAGLPEWEWASLPERYALVEVVNNHDDALQFEPIHRLLSGVDPVHVMEQLHAMYPQAHTGGGEGHTFRVVSADMDSDLTVPHPAAQLAVGTLQAFLDDYIQRFGGEVDYIHGDDVTCQLGSKPGCMGFLLPAMGKEQLFPTVMTDGVLPRKTFSMGHAQDKRYYIESRKIVK